MLLSKSPQVGRLLQPSQSTSYSSLPPGLQAADLVRLYSAALSKLLARSRWGTSLAFVALDTRTLRGLDAKGKASVLNSLKTVYWGRILDAGGEVLLWAGLAERGAGPDVLGMVRDRSRSPGMLLYLRVPRHIPTPPSGTSHITAEAYASPLGGEGVCLGLRQDARKHWQVAEPLVEWQS
jgi:hypothetical protein